MTNGFTAVVEQDAEWFIAYSPELPGANGQGKTKEEALESLSEAIALILEDRSEDGLRGVPCTRKIVTLDAAALRPRCDEGAKRGAHGLLNVRRNLRRTG
jgi:predicted RNase H-like HicB family nuclease